MIGRLIEVVELMAHKSSAQTDALNAFVEQMKTEFEWKKAHSELATKHDLHEMEKRIMVTLQDIIDDAADESTVIASVVTLLTTLSQQLKDAGTDPAKLQALKDLVDANKKAIADAIVANTPAAPTP